MPSHTWNEVGRWGDSVRANLEAWHSDLKAAIGEGFAIYPAHNLHMLLYAASMDGQGAIAMQAGKDYAKRTSDSMYQALTLIRFGRFDEVVEVTKRPKRDILGGVVGLRPGLREAENRQRRFREGLSREACRKVADTSKAEFRSHPAKQSARHGRRHSRRRDSRGAAGDLAGAIAKFERAVKLEDEMDYDEPEPLPFPARHWLGAALLEAKRYADAERVYREELDEHPHNGWSLLGSAAGARRRRARRSRRSTPTSTKSWSRSDTWIRASRF